MKTITKRVPFAYLTKQFADTKRYFKKIEKIVARGDFTLGQELKEFEAEFAKKLKVKHAISVASGTDALYLVLKALNIGEGDEVITAPNSFIATTAVIALVGAKPVFVDVRDDYNIDPDLIKKAITGKTKAIMPVHLAGNLADMYPILEIAEKHHLFVVEDVAQAAMAKYDGRYAGTFGIAGAFSFHPMKILNIWGDGGMITTNDDKLAQRLKLWRNHGLVNREECEFFAHNSRMDTIQAAVATIVMSSLDGLIRKRQRHARIYDKYLGKLEPWVHIPDRNLCQVKTGPTFTNYIVQVKKRKSLIGYLKNKGIDSVIHYPIPIHFQKAAKHLGYKRGDFPVTEKQADMILTLPDHQYLSDSDILYVCRTVEEFYRQKI